MTIPWNAIPLIAWMSIAKKGILVVFFSAVLVSSQACLRLKSDFSSFHQKIPLSSTFFVISSTFWVVFIMNHPLCQSAMPVSPSCSIDISSLSPFILLIPILPQFSSAFNCLICEGEDCLDPERWIVQSCTPNVNICCRLEAIKVLALWWRKYSICFYSLCSHLINKKRDTCWKERYPSAFPRFVFDGRLTLPPKTMVKLDPIRAESSETWNQTEYPSLLLILIPFS